MQRRTTEKVEKENQSTFSRNAKVPATAANTGKNDLITKGPLTAEKATTAASQRNVVKQVLDTKKIHGPKPATTEAVKGKRHEFSFLH